MTVELVGPVKIPRVRSNVGNVLGFLEAVGCVDAWNLEAPCCQ